MAEEGTRRALGRGLAALIGEIDSESELMERVRASRRVPVAFLRPNPHNPRRRFASEELEDLASSIRVKGIVQPILVRPVPGERDAYEIIAGERRWRAAQQAGLHDVPVLVHEASDKEALELAIIENVQRADLNPLEEAAGYSQLIETHGYGQGELAQAIGKSRSYVANTLRLLKLPEAVQEHLRDGRLSAGHARALITAPDAEEAARRIIEGGLSVREAEALVATRSGTRRRTAPRRAKDADTVALEKALTDAIGLTVVIDHRPNGGGELKVRYLDLEQLDEVCRRLQR